MVVEYIAATAAAVVAYRLSRRAYRDYLRPKIKGALGESGVKRELRKLSAADTEILHDLLLPIPPLIQISHLAALPSFFCTYNAEGAVVWTASGEESETFFLCQLWV